LPTLSPGFPPHLFRETGHDDRSGYTHVDRKERLAHRSRAFILQADVSEVLHEPAHHPIGEIDSPPTGVPPEEFLRASVEEWLSRPRSGFAEAASYVLQKNTELYRRLA